CALTSIGLLLYTGREASILIARPVLYTYWLPILLFFSAMQVLPTLLALGTRREPVYQRDLAMWCIGSLMLLAVCTGFW
ncbi:tetrathionate reductase subunit C, partial [Proteus mirabilis]|nr:tetrathionate reductase subunit C [Proteus mirabilis]